MNQQLLAYMLMEYLVHNLWLVRYANFTKRFTSKELESHAIMWSAAAMDKVKRALESVHPKHLKAKFGRWSNEKMDKWGWDRREKALAFHLFNQLYETALAVVPITLHLVICMVRGARKVLCHLLQGLQGRLKLSFLADLFYD